MQFGNILFWCNLLAGAVRKRTCGLIKKILQPGVPRLAATVQHKRGVPGLCAVQMQQQVVPLVAASLQSTQGACEMEIHGLGLGLGMVHQQHRRRVLVQYRSSQMPPHGRRALVYRGLKN